jgi:hypothetical protein
MIGTNLPPWEAAAELPIIRCYVHSPTPRCAAAIFIPPMIPERTLFPASALRLSDR